MNRILAFSLALISALMLLASCSAAEDDGEIKIVATNFAMYDFARAVCGDLCTVEMLLSPGAESHDFEAMLEDIAKIADADVFVYVGGESEAWVDGVFASIGASAAEIKKVRAMELVELCYDDGENHEGHTHTDDEADEHVWTAIPNAILIIDEIARAVAECIPESAEVISARAEEYKNELSTIDREMCDIVKSAERGLIVVADRFPFRYMTEHLGLEYYAAFSGCTSDTEPSLAVINELVELVQSTGTHTVFVCEFSDRKTASAIADETGAKIVELSSAHNVTKAEFDEGITYADIMRKNMAAIRSALE